MAEKEYIEREVAFDMITDLAGSATTKAAYVAIWKSARELNKIPAADVVEVVRCKDCKHYHNYPNGLCYANTEPYGTGYKGETICVDPDDYCSYGERKELENG